MPTKAEQPVSCCNSYDLARVTPAGLACEMSPYPYHLGRHLNLLNNWLMELAAGRTRRLMVTMPPRHGKSELCSCYFPTWFLGNFPDKEVILCSYEADFAASWGRKVRDTLTECCARGIFAVQPRQDLRAANRWEIARQAGGERQKCGGMATAGAGGAITGRGADLLIIDDPFKNAEEANSEVIREKVWDWWQSTASTRLSPTGVVLIINTRWHLDDLSGRLLEREPENWQLVNFPAIAEGEDVLGRQAGEALWPERYPLPKLREIQRSVGSYWWQALYQQRPVARGGEMFRREWFHLVQEPPARVVGRVRYWDRAGTEATGSEDPDWTVGALVSLSGDGHYCIEHVERFRGSPLECERRIRQTAERDDRQVPVFMEQEPGSSGVDTIDNYRRRVLVGYSFRGDRVTVDKLSRADIWAAPAEAGNVSLVRGAWNEEFLAEVEQFPRGKKKDQVDAVSGAVKVLGGKSAASVQRFETARRTVLEYAS